jgi:hypothetical protein
MNVWTNLLGKKAVRVHLKGDAPSLEGILVSSVGRHLKLVGAKAIVSDTESYNLDGTVIVPRETVAFWQVLAS